MRKYRVEYGSNSQYGAEIVSNSRNAIKHGKRLIGASGGGGRIDIYTYRDRQIVSSARYTPDNGGYWYNCTPIQT